MKNASISPLMWKISFWCNLLDFFCHLPFLQQKKTGLVKIFSRWCNRTITEGWPDSVISQRIDKKVILRKNFTKWWTGKCKRKSEWVNWEISLLDVFVGNKLFSRDLIKVLKNLIFHSILMEINAREDNFADKIKVNVYLWGYISLVTDPDLAVEIHWVFGGQAPGEID